MCPGSSPGRGTFERFDDSSNGVEMDIALGKEAVNLLSQARLNKIPLPRLPEKLRPKNESEAYYIQSLFHKYLVSSGYGNISGRKIGCTSEVMQNYLGIKTPCVGAIYSSGIQKIHGKFLFDDFIRPGVECEIAVILGTDLGDNGFEYDRNSVEPFVSSVMCAIEIVDDRLIDYKSVDTYSLISDDFFGSGCVVGEYKDPASINLREINGRILVRDKLVGMGVGRDIMGHPFEALAWLANFFSHRKDYLRKGEIISLGSIVETIWVNKGDQVEVRMENLGNVKVDFL